MTKRYLALALTLLLTVLCFSACNKKPEAPTSKANVSTTVKKTTTTDKWVEATTTKKETAVETTTQEEQETQRRPDTRTSPIISNKPTAAPTRAPVTAPPTTTQTPTTTKSKDWNPVFSLNKEGAGNKRAMLTGYESSAAAKDHRYYQALDKNDYENYEFHINRASLQGVQIESIVFEELYNRRLTTVASHRIMERGSDYYFELMLYPEETFRVIVNFNDDTERVTYITTIPPIN